MASRDDDKVTDGMIRRTLAHDAPEPAGCPSPEILAAYYERSLDADETARCELHFSRCARCREQVATILRTEEKPHLHPAPRWLLTGRWLVPAIAMLLIGTAYLTRRPSQRTPAGHSSNAPLVTMSKSVPNPAIEGKTSSATSSSAPASARKERKAASSDALNSSTEMPPSTPSRDRHDVAALPLVSRNPTPLLGVVGGSAGGVAPGGEVADRSLAKKSSAAQPPVVPKAVTESTEVTVDAASVQVAPADNEVPAHNQTQSSTSAAAPAQREGTRMMDVMPSNNAKTAIATNQAIAALPRSANEVVVVEASSMSVIKTPDPAVLWRIVGEGLVERSNNSGETWDGQSPYPNANFMAGVAPTTKICWLVGRDGMIVLTRDGKHWRKVEAPVSIDLVGVTAKDASAAVVTAVDGRKFATTNGGKKWTPAQ